MDVKRDILWRVYLSFLGVILICAIIIGRAVYIQQAQGSYWRGMADSLHLRFQDLDAERGTIYADDGSMLSTSIPYFNIYIDFAADGLRDKNGKVFKEKLDSLTIQLAGLFQDQTAADYKRQLTQGYKRKNRYYLLHKNVSFRQYQELRKFALVRLGKNKSGFIIEVKSKRLNPYGLLANRTIGLARENAKNVGLERTYDSLLKGNTGRRLVRQISGGAFVPVEGSEIDPENGKDIITTIDVNMQDIAQQALYGMMAKNEALEGTCIVMEVATGKIKAIANLARQTDGTYFESDNFALKTSEPGSTIKLVTLLAALEDKKVNINTIMTINGGRWTIGRRTIVDDHHGPMALTLRDAFKNSSNVAMSKLAYQFYTENPSAYYAHLDRLRLPHKTGIDLKEEFKPTVRNPKKASYWHPQTLASWGFGYELMVSPLQMLMVYNAVANNGKLMRPYLVQGIAKNGVLVQQVQPQILEKAIASPETISQLRNCLEAVCTEGTGKNAFATALYKAAGKTGTAKVNDGKFKYADGVYQSAFAGYFPADQPKYSCIVVIKNRPHAPNYYGGTVAAPVFREVADKLYAYTGVTTNYAYSPKPDSLQRAYAGYFPDMQQVLSDLQLITNGNTQPKDGYTTVRELHGRYAIDKVVNNSLIPDLSGMGLKDALYWCENKGLMVKTSGRGKVIGQSILPGAPYKKGQTIQLILN